jgi:hypothetical protein
MRHPVGAWLRATFAIALLLAPLELGAQGSRPSSAALSLDEEASLEEIRDFARATAARYGMVAPLEVAVASWVGSESLPQFATAPAVYTRGTLYLSRRLLKASNRDLVIAKALAYETLRAPSSAASLAERRREQAGLALESNDRAIDILVEVRGVSEAAALEEMYAWLIAIHRSQAARGASPVGALSACDEIADLFRRRAQSRAGFAGRDCVPP